MDYRLVSDEDEPAAPASGPSLVRALRRRKGPRRMPLFHRVLFGNIILIAAAAMAGAVIQLGYPPGVTSHLGLNGALIISIIAAAAAMNWVMLRTTFSAVADLNRLIDQIESGNLYARAHIREYAEPVFADLGYRLNRTVVNLRARIQDREREIERTQALTARLISAQEAEKKRLARRLQEETGELDCLFPQFDAGASQTSSGPPAGEEIVNLKRRATSAISELRGVILELRPALLEEMGLIGALQWYLLESLAQRGLTVSLVSNGLENCRFAPEAEVALFRIVQEALSNVLAHSHAHEAQVVFDESDGQLTLTISDNGCGFDPGRAVSQAPSLGHLGLFTMEQRASILGGEMGINSSTAGTTVTIKVPVTGMRLEPQAA